MFKKHHEALQADHQAIAENRRAVFTAAQGDTPNEEAIRTAADKLAKSIAATAIEMSKLRADVRQVLTDEQRAKLKELREGQNRPQADKAPAGERPRREGRRGRRDRSAKPQGGDAPKADEPKAGDKPKDVKVENNVSTDADVTQTPANTSNVEATQAKPAEPAASEAATSETATTEAGTTEAATTEAAAAEPASISDAASENPAQ